MSQNAPQRLYLMQVGSMPEYQIPIVCYLVQTGDGKNILIDSGLPEIIPDDAAGFENGQDVIEQLRSLTPESARAIGEAALKRVLADHTYAHRGAQVDALLRAQMASRMEEVAA